MSNLISLPGSVELRQLVSFTSATSSGLAKVISTHWIFVSNFVCADITKRSTYVVERGTMLGSLDDLDGGIVADVHGDVCWKRHLWYTELALVHGIRWSENLENRDHGMRHVQWLSAQSQVDVEECFRVALKPARLDTDSTAANRPFCSVCRSWHTTAWLHVSINTS